MLPRERVLTTLAHREPDVVPWGEYFTGYNIYEMALGRRSWVHAKFRESKRQRFKQTGRASTHGVVTTQDPRAAQDRGVAPVWGIWGSGCT